MKKSKLMKALLVFGMSVVTATSIVGFTACGHDHIDEDQDGKCDICDEVMTPADGDDDGNGGNQGGDNTGGGNEGGGNEGGGNEGGGETETKGDVVINIADITGTIADGTTLGEGVTIHVLPDKTAPSVSESGGKRPLVAGQEITNATSRMTITSNKNGGIKLDLSADATVIVYANSANGDDRTLGLYSDLSGTPSQSYKINATSNDLDSVFFNVKGGETSYIGASNNLYIFYIIVSFKTIDEAATFVGAPTCTEPGNSVEHYKTNYGRYYTVSGETKSYVSVGDIKKTAQNKLGHSYALKAGSLVIPTDDAATNPGKVVLKCDTCQHEEEVALPVLSSDKYTQTEIPGESNKVTYSITLSEMPDTPVTFEAAPTSTKETVWTTVYAPAFATAYAGIGKDNATEETGGKSYYTKNKDTDADTAVNVSVADGVLSVTGANVYCDLNDAITSGLVKISGKINVKANNTGWTFLQLKDSTGAEIFGIRAEKNVGLVPRFMGTADTSIVIATSYTNTEIEFVITIDCTSKKVSLKWGGTDKFTDVSLTADTLNFASLMLNVNASRTVDLADLVIEVPEA